MDEFTFTDASFMPANEKHQFVNLMKENTETLMLGFKENLDLDLHRDGTQNAEGEFLHGPSVG